MVQLSHEHGFSYGSGVFTLENSIAADYKEALVAGASLLLRTGISYSAAARMSNSKKAFVRWSELVVGSMVNSVAKRLEIQNLYGQSPGGIGIVSTNTPGAAGVSVLLLTTASWSSGIWAGSEGMQIDVYETTRTTLRNTTTAITVTAVDLTARTITISGLDAETDAIVATDVIVFRKAESSGEGNGLDFLLTASGTVYNISNITYSLWKGNTYSAASAALTFAKVQAATALAVERGLESEVTVMVSPKTWTNLQSDQAALRKYQSAGDIKNAVTGPESIKFFGQAGAQEIVPSIYIKEGEAYIFPKSLLKRLGSSDVTFKMPGKSEDELYLQIPDKAGYELRCYTEQNLFVEAPAKCVKITGIVNT